MSVKVSRTPPRSHLELELRERDRQLSTLIGNLPGAVYRCRNDDRFTTEYVSDGITVLTGYPADDFRSGRLHYSKVIHPDDFPEVERQIRECVRAGVPFEFTYRIRTAAGDIRWIWEKGSGIRNSVGDVVAVEGFATDVTDRKAVSDALRRRELQLTSIYDTVGESIFHLTVEGEGRYRFASVNQAFLATSGLRYEDIVGKSLDEVFGEPLLTSVVAHLNDAVRNRRTIRWDETGEFPTGRLEGEVTVAPVISETGECTHVVGSARDMTARNRTEEELRFAGERLKALSRQLLEIREVERRQLAIELHDELGQSLTAAKIALQSLKRFSEPELVSSGLEDSITLVERAVEQVRSLSLELRPPMLDDLGLGAAVNWLVDQYSHRSGFLVALDDELHGRRFEQAVETACFRVAQEALTNIMRHSDARSVQISLGAIGDTLHLRITDDGRGFDVNEARSRASHGASMGLLGMEERAALAGGGITWTSRPDFGTEVHAWFDIGRKSVASSTRARV